MGVDQQQQDGMLQRHVMALIVSYLGDLNLTQAATAVSNSTLTPVRSELPPNRLLDLVRKGLAVERGEEFAAGARPFAHHSQADGPTAVGGGGGGGGGGASLVAGYGSLPPTTTMAPSALDFSSQAAITKGSSSSKVPKYESRHISEHKNAARCARFSPDGRLLATGSADTSIKLVEVDKVRQMMATDVASRDTPVRPVIRTYYDHIQPINDIDFHPQSAVLISGAKDRTIKFFDFAKAAVRRAFRVIQDTHNVRSISFHPGGDYLLAGTDHHIAHLYDVNTFQCYLSTQLQDQHLGGAINQVRYSSSGGMYVSASKDGGVRIWDGVNARCVRAILGAHGSAEATSASFSKDQRYVLSCGKDSTIKMWEVASGRQVQQYLGAKHSQMRCQAVFSKREELILSVDEVSNEVVIWDSLSGSLVLRLPSNHANAPRWIEHSPTEAAFATCGTDRSVRFWREVA